MSYLWDQTFLPWDCPCCIRSSDALERSLFQHDILQLAEQIDQDLAMITESKK